MAREWMCPCQSPVSKNADGWGGGAGGEGGEGMQVMGR